MLKQAKDQSSYGMSQGVLSSSEMERIVIASTRVIETAFLILDALNESPEEYIARHVVLEGLERLVKGIPTLKILATN